MTSNDKKIQGYISPELYASVEAYASYHQISVSKAVGELVIQGLAGFSRTDNSGQILHSPLPSFDSSSKPIDISQFVTRAEFESKFNALVHTIGYTEGQIASKSESMLEASRFIREQSLNKLMQEKGLSRFQAKTALGWAEYLDDEA